MKIVSTVARYLLALAFIVFGSNNFLNFLPTPPPPAAPITRQFVEAMVASHYLTPVFALQLVAGILFLFNRFTPLALTLIAPIIVNILLFHLLMDLGGILPGLIVTICWILVFIPTRASFRGIFQPPQSSI